MSFLYRIHRYIFGEPAPFSSFDAEQMLNYITSNINNNYDDNDYIMLIKYLCENDNHKKYNYNTPKDAINDINMKLNQFPKLYMGEYERYLMYNLYQYLDDDVLLKYLYNCEYLEHNLRGIKFTKHLLKMMEEREYIRDRVAIVMDICVADNPQVRILSRQYKTGCDKSKVRSALLNCAHHICVSRYSKLPSTLNS